MYYQSPDQIETLSKVLQQFNRAVRSIKNFYFELHPEQELSFKDRVLLDFEEFLVVKQQTNPRQFDTFLESTKEVYQFVLGTSYVKIHKDKSGISAYLYVYNTPLVQILTLPSRLNRLLRCSPSFKNFFVSAALAQNFVQCDDAQLIKNAIQYCTDQQSKPFQLQDLSKIAAHPLMQMKELSPSTSFYSINQLGVIFINPKKRVKFEEVLTAQKIQHYSTTPIATFSSSPDIQYSIWFLATPFPVIATDLLTGHNGLVGQVKVAGIQEPIAVAHPIHTVYLHLYNLLTVFETGVANASTQVAEVLQHESKLKYQVQWGSNLAQIQVSDIDRYLRNQY